VKVKFNRRQEFVVGGFKPNATGFESLLVGYYEGRKLMFASSNWDDPPRPISARWPIRQWLAKNDPPSGAGAFALANS
jgi:hypothetical protein